MRYQTHLWAIFLALLALPGTVCASAELINESAINSSLDGLNESKTHFEKGLENISNLNLTEPPESGTVIDGINQFFNGIIELMNSAGSIMNEISRIKQMFSAFGG